MKTLQEILARKAELRTMLEDPKADLKAIETELRSLNESQEQLEKREQLIKEVGEVANKEVINTELEQRSQSQPLGATKILSSYGVGSNKTDDAESRKADIERVEKRGDDLKNKRAVTFELSELPELRAVSLGSSNLVAETKYSSTLNDTFNQVSSTIDLVSAVPLMGGESYEKGFVTGYGEGDYTTETGNYNETDATFDYVSIGKSKITAYTEMSDEAIKLPNINYQDLVRKNIIIAIRKKISKQILAGAGGSNALTGIFNAPTNVIPTESDLTITEIDADTLDNIVFGYGGEEDVEGTGHLLLNKKDLAKFAEIRTSTGEKLYKITLNGNTGTISSSDSFQVPFIINSACKSTAEANSGEYCMAYGMLHCYEMPIFSAVTVEESRDFKFRTGQIAYRGSVWAGGNVAMYKGFIRVKKG
jgi:HK97 family phage major capsid protein